MEREKRRRPAFAVCFLLLSLVLQSLVAPVVSRKLEGLGEQKNYYSPDPSNSGSGSGGTQPSHNKPCPCETPSHGGGSHGGRPSHGGSHGNPPSHGGGGYTPSPPSSGGGYNPSPLPPSSGGGYNPTPSTPDPSSGGGYNPSPSPPSGGGDNCEPPTAPSHGGYGSGCGGNCGTPTSPSHGGHGSGGHHSSPPSTPVIDTPPGGYYSPPTTPDPNSPTPGITTPPSPTTPDPNNPPFVPRPFTFWIAHPEIIWALFGYWGTLGGLLGTSATTVFGGNPTLMQALSNTRTDAIGELYREGTAAFINSVATKKFTFTTQQVKDAFLAAMKSNKAAAAQAKIFKQANDG